MELRPEVMVLARAGKRGILNRLCCSGRSTPAYYENFLSIQELTIVREAKRHNADAFHRLRSVPGIGKVLALTILYDIHDITRFNRVQGFASYARLVKCKKQSGGKTLGTGGQRWGTSI